MALLSDPTLYATAAVRVNAAPTIATSAQVILSPLPNLTATLSVLGADDAGESGLLYTWSTTGAPPAPVSFSANASNAAKTTVANFTMIGIYNFVATVKDAQGLSVTSPVQVEVHDSRVAITWTPTASLGYGTPLLRKDLSAQAAVPGSFTYAPDFGAVLDVGAQVLTATFIPADLVKYKSSTVSRTIMITQATAAIDWSPPAELADGEVMSDLFQNATASVEGEFAYDFVTQISLSPGSHALRAIFTPRNSAIYAVQTVTRTVFVHAENDISELRVGVDSKYTAADGSFRVVAWIKEANGEWALGDANVQWRSETPGVSIGTDGIGRFTDPATLAIPQIFARWKGHEAKVDPTTSLAVSEAGANAPQMDFSCSSGLTGSKTIFYEGLFYATTRQTAIQVETDILSAGMDRQLKSWRISDANTGELLVLREGLLCQSHISASVPLTHEGIFQLRLESTWLEPDGSTSVFTDDMLSVLVNRTGKPLHMEIPGDYFLDGITRTIRDMLGFPFDPSHDELLRGRAQWVYVNKNEKAVNRQLNAQWHCVKHSFFHDFPSIGMQWFSRS